MHKKLVKICSWCNRIEEEHEYSPLDPKILNKLNDSLDIQISHTMCPDCYIKLTKGGNYV